MVSSGNLIQKGEEKPGKDASSTLWSYKLGYLLGTVVGAPFRLFRLARKYFVPILWKLVFYAVVALIYLGGAAIVIFVVGTIL